MKKTVLLLTIVIGAYLNGVAQDSHEAKVLGVLSLSNKDYASIIDLETGDLYKTATYQKGKLVSNEVVTLDFTNNPNDEKAKVVKSNLNQNIFAFKEANDEATNNSELNNPYEFVGVNHNLALEAIGQSPKFPEITKGEGYNIIQQVIKERTGEEAPLSLEEVESSLKHLVNIDYTEINGSVTSVVLIDHNLTAKQVQLLDNLFNRIISAPNATALSSKIKGLEKSLAVRNDLTDDEKIVLFISHSVARNSNIFWEDATTNESNPWNRVVGDDTDPGDPSTQRGWLKQLVADVVGAVIGYLDEQDPRQAQASGSFASALAAF
jgi:hypothetical protein